MGYQSEYDDEHKPRAHHRTPSKQFSASVTPTPNNHVRRLSFAYKPAPSPLPLISRRTLRRAPLISLVALACILFYTFNPLRSLSFGAGSSQTCSNSNNGWMSLSDVRNETLGFEKIFVINLAKRTDKRDSMTLAAALTGMRLEYIDGVNGSSVSIIPNPEPEEEVELVNGAKGCWRSHLNILEEIVSENVASALILEDDADWDIRLKSQLSQFAHATRIMSQPRINTIASFADPTFPLPLNKEEAALEINLKHPPSVRRPKFSPYGDSWDLLWLGHCGTRFPTAEQDPRSSRGRVVNYNDPTVPQPHHLYKEWGTDDLTTHGYPNHTRVYHHTSKNVCTLAYAVSQAGARRILYDIGVVKTDNPIDLMLRAYCDGEDERRGGRACFTVQPQLFQHYRPRGHARTWSDITNSSTYGHHDKDLAFNIRWSTRMNLGKLVEGEQDYMDQWPNI